MKTTKTEYETTDAAPDYLTDLAEAHGVKLRLDSSVLYDGAPELWTVRCEGEAIGSGAHPLDAIDEAQAWLGCHA